MPKINDKNTRKQRKEDADFRIILRREKSAEAQLELLDDRLGKGVGAVKERARLALEMK